MCLLLYSTSPSSVGDRVYGPAFEVLWPVCLCFYW